MFAGAVQQLRRLVSAVTGGAQRNAAGQTMHILAGQGNPGPKYAGNRHNIGFMIIDRIARDHGFGPWRTKFRSEVSEGMLDTPSGRRKILLVKPQTFYNETGRALAEAARFYKLSAADVTVFHDEIDLAPGRLRVKRGGGHSGNNGIRSIIQHLGADVRRVRVGVGHPGDKSKVMPYVLADIPKGEEAWADALMAACSDAAGLLVEGDDERYQTEVMRLAPAAKSDPRRQG